jgi:hypothetical protein
MSVYKVIQDVEAEDKLLGPLSLKGFIYALIAGTCAFINFKLLLIDTPLKWLFILLFTGPMILFSVLASPLGRDQPTEIWLLSRLRFFLKPRRRIWDQEGLSELVTVTVPKKEELHLTKDLSQTEVQSRLKTLATTLDTRGWAIKNMDVNLNVPDSDAQVVTPDSDRLVGAGGVPKQMAVADVHAADDIMDEKNNPTAKKFDSLMKQADDKRKRSLLASLKGLVDEDFAKPQKNKNQADIKYMPSSKKSKADLTDKEKELLRESKEEAKHALEAKLAKARAQFTPKTNANQVKPAAKPEQNLETKASRPKPVTPDGQSVKIELAQSGNAFSVATLSQLANRGPRIEQTGPDEVTISLH